MTGYAPLREQLETLDGVRPQRHKVSSGERLWQDLGGKGKPKCELSI